jgi:hypothetical protein
MRQQVSSIPNRRGLHRQRNKDNGSSHEELKDHNHKQIVSKGAGITVLQKIINIKGNNAAPFGPSALFTDSTTPVFL